MAGIGAGARQESGPLRQLRLRLIMPSANRVSRWRFSRCRALANARGSLLFDSPSVPRTQLGCEENAVERWARCRIGEV